jgi:hypothetical protein
MSTSNNPLKQYFRRPAIYIKLPSKGKYYTPDVLNYPETEEIPVYPMTAIDEITTKTPDALFNGNVIVDLIKSCIPDIKDPWKINNIDLDTILIGIKVASTGNSLELDSQCPACQNKATYAIDLNFVLSGLTSPDYEEKLEVLELKLKFNPLDYNDINQANLAQFDLQRLLLSVEQEKDASIKEQKSQEGLKTITELSIKLIAKTIEYVETPDGHRVDNKEFIEDFLRNCSRDTFNAIKEHNANLKEKTNLKPLALQCGECNHQYEQPFTLNVSDFFG